MLELRAYNDNTIYDSPEIDAPNDISVQSCENGSEEKKDTAKDITSPPSTTLTEDAIHYDHHNRQSEKRSNKEESEMRGVHAKTTIPPNSICVSIPKNCLITVEMGQATDIGQTIIKSGIDLDAPKHIFLMIFLLWDRKVNNDKSFFAPYYDILPKTLRNMPIFWSDEELKGLKGSHLLTQIEDRNQAITEDYFAICEVAPDLAQIATLEEFKWARMCVCSRNFGLQIDGNRTSALVPHADMLNHYRPRETKWTYDDDLQAFTITSLQTIPAGAQVYDSYGQKCNHRFLLNYGFAVEDNTEVDGFCPNEVPVELVLSPQDPLFEAKQSLWIKGDSDPSSSTLNPIGVLTSDYSSDDPVTALKAVVAAAAVVGGGSIHSQNLSLTMVQNAMDTAAATADLEALNKCINNLNSADQGRNEQHWKSMKESVASKHLLKRVRVCVSNNENTKSLFSMLRFLSYNVEELRSFLTAPALSIGDNRYPGYVSRAIRGYSTQHTNTNVAMMNHSAGTLQQPVYYRTYRDIRHPVSIRNERAAMKLLLDIVIKSLDAYPTTLRQDIDDLMNEQLYPRFSNRRHAKIQVRGEKEVLHHFALWAKTSLDVLEVIDREITLLEKQTEEENEKSDEPKVAIDNVPGFDYIINTMEEEEGLEHGVHHTILRYCSDVLGSLRREELKRAKREKIMAQSSA